MLYAGLEPEHEDRLDAQDTGPSHLFLRPSYLIIYWFHLLGGGEAEKLKASSATSDSDGLCKRRFCGVSCGS